MKKAFLNWSSGKDAAFALYLLQKSNQFSIDRLVTTVDSQKQRVSMHGLHQDLLVGQARKTGIPLQIINLRENVDLEHYNEIMKKEMKSLRAEGFTHSAFGDIFLEDLKDFREQQLQKADLKAIFPLWKMDTSELMRSFMAVGFKAITISVNANFLDKSFCGRIIDADFLSDLPPGVDPCGENGEFHTFVFDGPIFESPLEYQKGKISQEVFSAGKPDDDSAKSWDSHFWKIDLLPK